MEKLQVINITKKMDYQISLSGEKTSSTPPVRSIPVMVDFGLKDSIWQTLKFYYNSSKSLGVPELVQMHSVKYPICRNSIINNVQRLESMGWITIMQEDAGKTRSKKLFFITKGGEIMYDKFLDINDQAKDAEILKLYVFRDDNLNLIQLGTTFNVENKKRSLEQNSPLKLKTIFVIKGIEKDMEFRLKNHFENFRVKGDWFRADCFEQILIYLNENGIMTI